MILLLFETVLFLLAGKFCFFANRFVVSIYYCVTNINIIIAGTRSMARYI
jgi:hypothetical protein